MTTMMTQAVSSTSSNDNDDDSDFGFNFDNNNNDDDDDSDSGVDGILNDVEDTMRFCRNRFQL